MEQTVDVSTIIRIRRNTDPEALTGRSSDLTL